MWSVELYGSVTWTVNKKDKQRIEAFKTWCCARMISISWMDKSGNDEVLRRENEKNKNLKSHEQEKEVMDRTYDETMTICLL